ncbi:MAG: superoxide dismutase family protein [Rubricoccaceae bacterium]|nr:superoxide dismutase family protein [Rubricoccaceae bacterium]
MSRPLLLLPLLALVACAVEDAPSPTAPVGDRADGEETPAARPLGQADEARVDLQPVGRGGVSGSVRLVGYDEGTRIVLRAEGLAPGLHGVAVLDATDCADADDAVHFDPAGAPHGDPEDPRPLHHAGDLGNVRATDDGARLDRVFTDLRLDGPASVVGRVLAVHAGQDDLNTQPDGGAGAPVACGVIQPAE